MAAGISAGVAFIDILPNMAKFSAGIGAGLRKSGTQLMSYGARLTRILTVPILGVAAASVKMGLDYQRSMTLIKTQAGASTKELARMKGAVLDLAPKVGTGPEALAEGMFHVESVGYRGAKALKVLKTAAMGAKVGMSDVGDTASALAGVMLTNIRGTGNMSHAMGVLNGIVGAGNMHMQDLNEAIKSGIVPTAKTAGLSLQSLGAALAMMTDEGIPAGVSANRLRTALFMLTNPTEKAQKVLKSIGLNALSMGHALQGPNGLNEAMKLLRDHLTGINDPTKRLAMIGQMFGGSRSAGTIALLLNNLGRIDMKYKQIAGSARDYNKAVATTKQTAQFKLDQAWAAVQADLIKMSVTLIPIVIDLAGKLVTLSDAFQGLSSGAQKWIVYGALVAAAAGPIVFALGGVLTVIGGVVTGLAFLGTAMVTLATLVIPGLTLALDEAGTAMIAFGGAEAIALGPMALIAVGIAGVATAAYILWSSFSDGWHATDQLKDATNRARDAVLGLNSAISDGQSAHHGLVEARHAETASVHRVAEAQKAVNGLIKDGKKGTDEYKNAMDNLRSAQDGMYDAHLRTEAAQRKADTARKARVKAINADKTATEKLITTYNKQVAANKRNVHYGKDYQEQLKHMTAQNVHDLHDVQKQLEENAKAHEHNARVQEQKGNPAMAATERHLAKIDRAALQVSKKINDMPTFKQIDVQMQVNAEVAIQTKVANMTDIAAHQFLTGNQGKKKAPPHDAGGGPVEGGPHLIGEFGPELWVPESSGHIVANRDLSLVTGGGGGGNMRAVIVLDDGTELGAYVSGISDSSVARGDNHKRRLERMRR